MHDWMVREWIGYDSSEELKTMDGLFEYPVFELKGVSLLVLPGPTYYDSMLVRDCSLPTRPLSLQFWQSVFVMMLRHSEVIRTQC